MCVLGMVAKHFSDGPDVTTQWQSTGSVTLCDCVTLLVVGTGLLGTGGLHRSLPNTTSH